MKKPGFNPYLPSWEYVPDGEPHVFGGRVYVYGSHDHFNGYVYCPGDYVCWSAPVCDLTDWTCEGVIYKRTDDPENGDGEMCLYAPDVTQGPDGRYYLYYVLDCLPIVSAAVCDTPAGTYRFYGYVHYPDGILLGKRPGDQPQFDPGVLTEGETTWLYTGFCRKNDPSRIGSMVCALEPDMVTVKEGPDFLIPDAFHSQGTGFEGHEFFEASSIRKRNGLYYLIYSSILGHELCYAVSRFPNRDFTYGGVIVSNNDSYISTYKPAERPMYYGGNNHGSIVEIQGQWYVFYHRHTNGTNFSRQGCIEPITFRGDGSIPQAEMTSCGPNQGPLPGNGTYPAYIACNLYCRAESAFTALPGDWMDCRFPKITQDGCGGSEALGYIANLRDGAAAGFKYFSCDAVKQISVTTRGMGNGALELLTSWDGNPLGEIQVTSSNEWKTHKADLRIPDGVHALYFRYRGTKNISFHSFTLSADPGV